jgi:DNA-binding CsgD family transcriptional regulator
MRAEVQSVRQPWPAQTHPDRSLVRCGADLVHLTEELHIRLLALTLTMLGAAGVLTVPLTQTNTREHASVATVIFATLAIIASVSGLKHRCAAYRWLRATRAHQLAPAVVACAIVLTDGPYSPSWWTAEALLFIVAATTDLRTTLLASVSTATAYLAGTLLRGASILPGGDNEYLTVALAITVNPLVARAIAEVFAKFTLRLHQIELQTAEAMQAPIPVHVVATPVQADLGSGRQGGVTGKRRPRSSARAASRLTARQLEVALLARDGLHQAEIAAALAISPRQVERHFEQARERAGAATTAQLIAMLVTSGLAPASTAEHGISGG